jgi:hypothetical protein
MIRRPIVVAVAVWLTLIAVVAVSAHIWIPVTDQKQSAFVRTFDPTPIVQSFRGAPQRAACSTGWLKTSSSFASSAGYHFLNRRKDIQTRRTIDPTFCANPQQVAELMTSLHASLLSALSSSGCQVIADRLTTREGEQIVYRCGTYATGVALVRPPKKLLGENDGHITLSMQIDERWRIGS